MASFIKVSTFLAIIASLQQLTVATPPACLLACVAQVQKSSTQCSGLNDLSCICSNEGDDIKTCLDNICPNGDADAAKKAFSNSCSGHDDGSSNSSSSSSKAESSTESSSAASSSAEASSSSSSEAESSSEAAPSGSSSVAAESSSEAASSTTGGGAGGHESSAEPSSTLHTSTVAAQSSSSSSEVPAVSTQPGGSGASKVGLGALIGLVGAALL
ncbi:SSR1 [Candida metapsilosis]|uniref:SSR1 n=1 Tax=Candida metapsilosis TaxID=273372 RepID=A0A8H8DAL5_9ASCO|nr:SSR1 [Candida metapsilosis]